MKRILAMLVVLVMSACGAAAFAADREAMSDGYFIEGMPNPVEEQPSLEALSRRVGFEVNAPERLGEFERTSLSSIDTLAQMIYMHGDQELCYRISPADGGDNSGDYNDYAFVTFESVNGVSVLLKGNDNRVCLALWSLNGYDYSVGIREKGVSMDEMFSILDELGI